MSLEVIVFLLVMFVIFVVLPALIRGRLNFRLGWFRIEILPRFRIVFDVRRTVVSKKKKRKRS